MLKPIVTTKTIERVVKDTTTGLTLPYFGITQTESAEVHIVRYNNSVETRGPAVLVSFGGRLLSDTCYLRSGGLREVAELFIELADGLDAESRAANKK